MIANPEQPVPSSRPVSGVSMPFDRRRYARFPHRLRVEFLNMGEDPDVPFYEDLIAGETVDVSIGGMRAKVSYDIPEGTQVGLVVRSDDRFRVFLATVVWKKRGQTQWMYGLSVPKADLNLLK